MKIQQHCSEHQQDLFDAKLPEEKSERHARTPWEVFSVFFKLQYLSLGSELDFINSIGGWKCQTIQQH